MTVHISHRYRLVFAGAKALPAFLLGTALLLAAAGCEPRDFDSSSPERLLNPARDAPQYRRLTLANQIKVMLISDPRADRSAAALSVGVGSLDDPKERPGLVHFLEHMLFLGTEKYPEAGSYQKYLTSHAGFSNAYTADDHTNYYFGVAHDAFEGALDRFSQFFAAPLFNETYAGREVNAVDSEHSKNLESDYWRVRQVTRSSYAPDHPANRFSTGSLKTLSGVGNQELRAYYRAQYSANRMTLALASNKPLDELEALVRVRFEAIANHGLAPHRYPREYLPKAKALRVLFVEPVRDQRSLNVEFPLPPTQQFYRSKPLQLIGSVLGHEGEGSLLSLLKAKDLAATLSAGHGHGTADYSSFNVRIGLTPRGLERYQEVLGHLLGALRGMNGGVPRYIYEEARRMAEINYRYRPQPESVNAARGMSAMMQSVPLEDLPKAALLYSRFAPEQVAALLKEMTPDNMLVTVVAKGVTTDSTEPYYGTRFAYREIAGEAYETLRDARPDPLWRLPAPNPYIPGRTVLGRPTGPLRVAETTLRRLAADGLPAELREKLAPLRGRTFTGADALLSELERRFAPGARGRVGAAVLKDALALPVRLIASEQALVWYQAGLRFRQPKAHVILKFHQEGVYGSPRQAILGQLYEAGMEEALNEYGYPIRQAGLSYGISVGKAGVTLTLGGYSANMPALLRDVVSRLRRMPIDEQTFASLKERMQRALRNARFGQPYRQARYFRRQLLVVPNFRREALERELENVTLPELRAFAAGLFRKIYVEGVVYGNLAPATARRAVAGALATLGAGVLPVAKRLKREVRLLAQRADWVFTDRLKINNSFASYYYQVGRTNPRLRGALLIISRHLSDRFYFRMRTQQQLGYIVYAGMGQIKKMLSLNLLAQSGTYPADELLKRIEAFIPEFVEGFGRLSEAEFETFRRAVIQAKLKRSKTIADAAAQLFWIAFENDRKFDHVSEDILAVEALSRVEVEEILYNFLVGRGKKRLAIRLVGKEHPKNEPAGEPIFLPGQKPAKAG